MITQSHCAGTTPEPILEVRALTKRFGKTVALDQCTFDIPMGSIMGLVGSNGAGKSTFMRIAAGVLKQDGGQIAYRGQAIYDNPAVKSEILFVADNPWFFPDSNLETMSPFYAHLYPRFDPDLYQHLLTIFPLDPKMKFTHMSKGMQRQANLLLSLAARPRLILMDEAFDGLDPVMRQILKRLVASEVASGEMTVLIASHNIRELEDFCDIVSILHRGGLLCVQDIEDLKLGIFKVQTGFPQAVTREDLEKMGLNLLDMSQDQSVYRLLIRGDREVILPKLEELNPYFLDLLPLSLEEFFIYQLEDLGYGVAEILGGQVSDKGTTEKGGSHEFNQYNKSNQANGSKQRSK